MKKKEGCIPKQSPLHFGPTITDILQCLFGCNRLEVEIFADIFETEGKNIKEFSNKFDRDQSVIYRAVENLWELELVKKEKIREGVGRPYHLYKPVSLEKLKVKLQSIAERWYERVNEVIREL